MAPLLCSFVFANVAWAVGGAVPEDACTSSALLQKGISGTSRVSALSPIEQPDKAPSFAVFTRVIEQELPYLGSFVRHYAGLGARQFYMLSNREGDLPKVSTYFRDHHVAGANFTFLYREGGADDILASDGLLEAVREDYIVAVDVDEYWVLPRHVGSFADLVAKEPADIWYANWRIVVNQNLWEAPRPPYSSYKDAHTKWIARRSVVKTLWGIHTCSTIGENHHVRHHMGGLVHFYSRSFVDTVTKGLAQFFRDGTVYKDSNDTSGPYHGCEGLSFTKELLRKGDLPERLKVLAWMSLHSHTKVIHSKHSLLEIDTDAEMKVLQGLTQDSLEGSMAWIRDLHGRYSRFQACIKGHIASNPRADRLSPQQAATWLETLPCLASDV